MKKTICILLLLSLGFTAIRAEGGEKNFIDRPYIEVTGKAEMEILPDQIYLSIVINEKDNKGKVLLDQAEKNMISKLEKIHIDTKKDLSVKDMSSNFKNYWIKNSEIMTSKEYQLMVSNAQTAGKVIQELEKIGISNISIEKVNHSRIDQFRREVKVNAIKVAKEKATDMAQAIGQNAGKAIYIQEIEYNNFSSMKRSTANIMVKMTNADALKSEDVPDIEFEKIKLEYQVKAYFELN